MLQNELRAAPAADRQRVTRPRYNSAGVLRRYGVESRDRRGNNQAKPRFVHRGINLSRLCHKWPRTRGHHKTTPAHARGLPSSCGRSLRVDGIDLAIRIELCSLSLDLAFDLEDAKRL